MYLLMQVNFLSKLVVLKPGKTVQEMIQKVMQGKDEGADTVINDENNPISTQQALNGIAGRVRFSFCFKCFKFHTR